MAHLSILAAALLACAVSSSGAPVPGQKAAAPPKLAAKYETWLREEVVYIATDRETEVFRALPTDRERDLFIEEFWRQRDPTPNTPRNEFKEEHLRRIAFANETFGRGTAGPGWRTDRGRMYIILGMPADVERIMSSYIHGAELWTYQGRPELGQPSAFRLLFYQWGGSPDYRLYNPTSDFPKRIVVNSESETNMAYQTRRAGADGGAGWGNDINLPLIWDELDRSAYRIIRENVSADLAQALLSLIPGVRDASQLVTQNVLLGRIENSSRVRVPEAYVDDFLAHRAIVRVDYSSYHLGNRFLGAVLRDADGTFLLHYLLVPEKISLESYAEKSYAEIHYNVRLTDGRGRSVFQRDGTVPVNLTREEVKRIESRSFHFEDALPLAPGRYTCFVLWENTVTREFTSVQSEVVVPELRAPLLGPVLFNRGVLTGLDDAGPRRAFRVGTLQLNPVLDRAFGPSDRVYAYFQLLGFPADLLERGRLEFRALLGSAPVAEWTRPLREVKGGQDVCETIPLEAPEAGRYVLEAVVKNGDGATVISRRDEFVIAAKAPAGTWVSGPTVPGAGDPELAYDIGRQCLEGGRDAEALAALERAAKAAPAVARYAAGYARALIRAGRPADALAAVRPFTTASPVADEVLDCWGDAALGAGELREAVDAYGKALAARGRTAETLNSLGECHRRLGEAAPAAKAWRESLALKPDQPAIVEALKTVER